MPSERDRLWNEDRLWVRLLERNPQWKQITAQNERTAGQALMGLMHRLHQAATTLDITEIAKNAGGTTAIPALEVEGSEAFDELVNSMLFVVQQ